MSPCDSDFLHHSPGDAFFFQKAGIDRSAAKHCIKEAYARNRFDIRTRNLRELLK